MFFIPIYFSVPCDSWVPRLIIKSPRAGTTQKPLLIQGPILERQYQKESSEETYSIDRWAQSRVSKDKKDLQSRLPFTW